MKKYLFIIPIVLLVGLSACEKISNDERKKSNKAVPVHHLLKKKVKQRKTKTVRKFLKSIKNQ